MMQISFIAYLVGGAFLSLSYFDLPWHFVSFVVLLNKFIEDTNVENNPATILASNQQMQRLNRPNI